MKHTRDRYIKKWLGILLAFVIAASGSAMTGEAWAESGSDAVHYIAVASDRHETTDAIGITMADMPDSVEYVSLNGDMVNFGSGKTDDGQRRQDAYNTQTVLDEVLAVFPDLNNKNVSIVYGSHDANATDDAGIMKCADTSKMPSEADRDEISQDQSGLIYTGMDGDSAAYYVYGVSYYDMMDPETAEKEAREFMDWADENPGVPVIAIGHVPVHAYRNDNLGASFWNAAFNYAATGAEDGTEVVRDVVYLHGHNHTDEMDEDKIPVEYFVSPGEQLDIQGTTKKQSETQTIRYTYITAGYLMNNHSATLVEVSGGKLSFTKYRKNIVSFDSQGGSEVSDVILKVSPVADTFKAPAEPVRAGYIFSGWYKEAECKNRWDFGIDTVIKDITLYAGWTEIPKPAAPKISTVVKSVKKTAEISWTAAENANAYLVSYKKAADADWTAAAVTGSLSYKLTGLTKKGLYDLKVNAVNGPDNNTVLSDDPDIAHRYINSMAKLKVRAKKKAFRLTWKKDSKATAYQIRYSTGKSMKNAVTVTVSSKKSSAVIKALRSKKKYYIRMRPLVEKNGVTYYGSWSYLRSVRTR